MKPVNNIVKQFDNLVYLDDYVDSKIILKGKKNAQNKPLRNTFFFLAIEAVPLDLQRNFTLMRELDGYAQGNITK